jgi:hypothetical protein
MVVSFLWIHPPSRYGARNSVSAVTMSCDELLGQLVVDPVEGDVPDPVVDRIGDEQGR